MAKPNPSSPEQLLSLTEAGAELGIDKSRINKLINAGRLPAMRIGNMWVVRRADLELIRHRPTGRPPKKPTKGGNEDSRKKK